MDKKRILVVEDEAVTAMDLKSNLIHLGYDVLSIITSGEDAVRKTSELLPDLVLMDITLAGPMSGIEAADEIRNSQAIPVVFLTAHADAETIKRAKTTEPFGYLPKPVSMDTLMSTLEVALYKGGADAQRRIAEAKLKSVLEEQKIILDNIGAVVLFLKKRKIIWGSKSLSNIFGYSFEELFGKDIEILYPDIESCLEVGDKGYTALARGKVYTGVVRLKKKNGSLILCNIVGQPINPVNLELGIIWLLDDITDRKRMEEEIIKAKNLESLCILAGGIAHDFNNLFQGLLGNLDMAKHYTPETSKAFPFLENAESIYHTTVNLTNHLIALSPGGIYDKKTIQPNKLIMDTVSLTLSRSNINAVFDLPDDLHRIKVDKRQLSQVIFNITLNAAEAMNSGGILLVTAANETLGSGEITGLAPGKYIRISISDHGCGIPPDILPRIFDPYFSTKERGAQKGMGLGLTVSDAVIKKHDGLITAESEPGKGSTFNIYLPAEVPEV
jgi:PAS domain S-box-containing protein